MADIMDDVGTILPIMKDILQDVRTLTSGPIASAAENVNKMIETNSIVLQSVLTRVDHIAGDIDRITDIPRATTSASPSRTSATSPSPSRRWWAPARARSRRPATAMRSSLQKLQATVDNLDKSLKNVETITGRLEKGEGTAGHLLTDDTIARNVEDITEDAGGFVRGDHQAADHRGAAHRVELPVEQPKEYLSMQLVPRPDKFYLIEIVDDPAGADARAPSPTSRARTS
jgi:phospholipid/cholesterol/gamma-HCH transport system substrate-binding protein